MNANILKNVICLIVFMTRIYYQIACQKIVSGGQTGVDRGVLDACLAYKFSCGGWCPKDRLAEDGVIDQKYPLTETEDRNNDTRTWKNVQDSDGTSIFSPENLTGGTLLTYQAAHKTNKPVLIISPDDTHLNKIISKIIYWINNYNIHILNAAGPRKSEWNRGYNFSFQILSALITEIITSNHYQ
jgi:hypothetical protein